MPIAIDDQTEWLETDGLGGFASGTTSMLRTRRYHALLVSAATPPAGRFCLVNGVDAIVRTPDGLFPVAFHRYAPGVTNGAAGACIESFQAAPWPRWVIRLPDGTRVVHEVCMTRGEARTLVSWRLLEPQHGVRLSVRPLLSGRDYHSLHHENPAFRFDPQWDQSALRWSPYEGVPRIGVRHNGGYRHEPVWYRGFQYDQERERGFECTEDLASPGVFEFDLSSSEATIVFSSGDAGDAPDASIIRERERSRRASLGAALERAADAYLVRRGTGTTIIAGYPWFGDWGRDTFIALRGLCLATGRLDDARSILLSWAGCDSKGVLPNRFADQNDAPEYNTVDASLWFVVAAHEFLEQCAEAGFPLSQEDRHALHQAMDRILIGYAGGTHHGIRLDDDGLLAAGEPGMQLTWMDARVGDRVITPRIGKPVEVQALWLNALWIASRRDPRWHAVFRRGLRSFRSAFWNEAEGALFDVADVDHVRGEVDPSFRPNQVFAVGGLPLCLLDERKARRVIDAVESRLWTPLGLRSLAPGEPGYVPRYHGGPEERDGAYHQGTVWAWLLGAFVEGWVRVRRETQQAIVGARAKFLEPMLDHLQRAGLGHVSEIADAEAPHRPGGCPFQAWSLGELLRLERRVLAARRGAAQTAIRRSFRTKRGALQAVSSGAEE